MRTLLLKFSGPLQSFGTRSHFETRETDACPSKSAVVGMLAAALGCRRRESEKLKALDQLFFAVRIDQRGNLLRDYHIARKYKSNGDFERTYVTNRYYLEDAVYVVALSGEDDLIGQVAAALEEPYFQLYMGRRALPVNYDLILGVEEGTALDCLSKYAWQAAEWYQVKLKKQETVRLDLYSDWTSTDPGGQTVLRQDKVLSFSQKERKFDFRYERHCRVTVSNPVFKKDGPPDTEHDVFASLREG